MNPTLEFVTSDEECLGPMVESGRLRLFEIRTAYCFSSISNLGNIGLNKKGLCNSVLTENSPSYRIMIRLN